MIRVQLKGSSVVRNLAAILSTGIAASALAACDVQCPPMNAFEEAASYRWLINGERYLDPINSWVRNQPLEAFILKVYRMEGLNGLRSRYSFQCTARKITPPCADCHTCTLVLPKRPATAEWPNTCRPVGEMTIKADIGPGWTVSALTYWERRPIEHFRPTHTRDGEPLENP